MIRLLASVVLIVTSAGAGVGEPSGSSTRLSDRSPRAGRRVLIVPFENARHEPRVQWLSEAAAVLLSDELAARGLDAISRAERARAFDDLHLPASASLSRATVIKIGQLVSATEVIVGSFDVDGSTLAISTHIIRIDVGRLDPTVTDRASLTDLFGVFSRLAGRLAPDSRPGAAGPAHPSLDAFENYVKGLIAERPATQATFLEMAVRQQPSYDQARIALWDVRTDQADYAAALAAVRAVPAASPLAPQAHFLAALSLLDLKRLDEAFDAFKALVGGKPGAGGQPASAAVFNNLGIVQLRRGGTPQTGSATYYLTKAAELEPADPDYLFNLGYAYALEHNAGATVYWLREAVRRNPADADAHYVLGSVLLSSGSPVEGARERELARQLASRYEQQMERRTGPEVPKGLERVRVDSDPAPTAGAEQALASSAQRDQREQAAFHLERARRLFDRDEDREAMTELKRAVYLSPYEAKAHLLIGRIHLRAGRPKEAVDALEISVWSEDSAAARIALADAYLKLQQPDAAKTELVRALALDPASAAAKKMLETIK
jgi:tetratricopeptide (TPR) repeat protein